MKNVEFCGKTSVHFLYFLLFLFNSKTPKTVSLVTLVTNNHKFLLLPLVFRSSQKFEKHKLVLNFESLHCYFK